VTKKVAINVARKRSIVSKKFDVRSPKYTRTRENSGSSTSSNNSSISIVQVEKRSMDESCLSINNDDICSSK
jgi:hypothetical protein